MEAFEQDFITLISEFCLHAAKTPMTVFPDTLDGEERAHCVADYGWFEESVAGLDKDEAFQAIARGGSTERRQTDEQQAMG